MEYIGKSVGTFRKRLKAHFKTPSPIYKHFYFIGPQTGMDNFSIVGRELQNLTGFVKEAIFIRVNHPPLNWKVVKYQLPCIWHEVLGNNHE